MPVPRNMGRDARANKNPLVRVTRPPYLPGHPQRRPPMSLPLLLACRALVLAPGDVAALVDPFGSESDGVALVTPTAERGADRMACVYGKASKAADLTGAFVPPPP